MKIGILTQPLKNNYGGLLQNWALQQILINLGHEVITIDWEGKGASKWRIWGSKVKRGLLRVMRIDKNYFNYQPSPSEFKIISQNTDRFIRDNINHTSVAHISLDFRNELLNHDLTAIIVGSDQVWRPSYTDGQLLEMFLNFAKDIPIKRISYAASFGVDNWEFTREETAICKELINKFDLVTVRERSAIKLCKENFGVNAIQVLDPTMLLNKDDYQSLAYEDITSNNAGNLFCYILDESDNKKTIVKKVAEKSNLTPFYLLPTHRQGKLTKQDVKLDIENCIYPSVAQWLRAFMDSEMVICDSFHGCVFSIIFNKPFWVISNTDRGNTRFESLLKMFGLEERMIDDITTIDVLSPIDWSKVNGILSKKRNDSIALLQSSLTKYHSNIQ